MLNRGRFSLRELLTCHPLILIYKPHGGAADRAMCPAAYEGERPNVRELPRQRCQGCWRISAGGVWRSSHGEDVQLGGEDLIVDFVKDLCANFSVKLDRRPRLGVDADPFGVKLMDLRIVDILPADGSR